MEFKDIKELIKIIDSGSLTEFKLELDKFSIMMKKDSNNIKKVEVINNDIPKTALDIEEPQTSKEDEKIFIVESPILGIFYSSSSPNEKPYVKVGSTVKKGDILCIIEAMKMMNEITCEVDGQITEILVSNESPVEYNQPLFKVRMV